MQKHIVISNDVLTTEVENDIKGLLNDLVINTSHNGATTSFEWYAREFVSTITITPKVNGVLNYDVLMACFYRDLNRLKLKYPDLEKFMRIAERDARDYHGWFSATDDTITYNMARQDQYMLRECYGASGCRGHVGFSELKNITGIRVFGEPNNARKVLKMIQKETQLKTRFIDLRPGATIMNQCGSSVMVLVEATNGQFQIINDGIPVSSHEVLQASDSPYKNVDYTFLYNHPLFQ